MKRVVCALAVTIAVAGCAWGPFSKKKLDWRPDRNHSLQDLMEVRGELSDTLISISQLGDLRTACGDLSPVGRQFYHSAFKLLLKVEVQNISTEKVMFPKRDPSCAWVFGEDTERTITLIGGKEGEPAIFNARQLGYDLFLESWLDYFAPLASGDNRVLADSIEVLCAGNFPMRSQGRFWVLVKVQNYYWKESATQYWTGEVWSDTLWFRIVE